MKLLSSTFLLLLLCFSFTGCRDEENVEMHLDSSKDKICEMIQEFHHQLHPESRSDKLSFRINGISTDTYLISEENKTRTTNHTESFDIHTVTIDFEGIPGYAILSDTPGIEKIFYYTEEGCIGDTATIAPLKEMIESFPLIAEDIITGKIVETRADFPNYPNIDPIVRFHWHQLKPFNNYSAYCACSICSDYRWGNHRPLGCITIAMGQAIATVKKFTGTFYGNRDINFDNLPVNDYSGNNPQYLQLAHFLQEIALNCQTQFGCNKSGSRLEAAFNYLVDLGYSP